jgi:transcriptional regulator with XRE-family HTH domain
MTRPVEKRENESARLLGAELRSARVARGLSLRALAKSLGLNGHGNLVDYEYGRRIPPEDLLAVWERALGVRDNHFRDLRAKALAERADRQASVLLAAPPEPEAEMPAGKRSRWRALALAVALFVATGTGVWTLTGPRVRMGFETDATRWWVLYGSQVARIAYSTIAYEGGRAEQVTLTGASASKGYSAVGIAHDLDGLHSGSKVTLHLWVPGPQEAGVAFFVHDSRGVNHWAVESQGPGTQQVNAPLPGDAGWATYTWTVPDVDTVSTIGMQIWAENDQPVIVGVDAVDW